MNVVLQPSIINKSNPSSFFFQEIKDKNDIWLRFSLVTQMLFLPLTLVFFWKKIVGSFFAVEVNLESCWSWDDDDAKKTNKEIKKQPKETNDWN